MYTRFGFIFLFLNLHSAVSQDCTLPQELWGNWTSTNLGTIVVTGTSPSLTFTKVFTAQNVTENAMECRFTSGSQYILESVYQIYTFSSTNPIFMWMCLDLRRASAYSYYYYLNSPVEFGFDGYRLVGLPHTTTFASDVCTETPDTAEFYMMIRNGHETDAVDAVQCASPLFGYFSYTYTDSTGTYCENANSSYINVCDNSDRTHVLVNNSDCSSINPFYSASGQLGCIANVYDSSSDVYYISLYNLDSSPTTQFICTAVTRATDGTVYLSMKQTECDSGQSPTTLSTGGATMILSANFSVSQDCTLPEELWGVWTSSNLGTITIVGTSPSLKFTKVFTAQNVILNEMDCRFTSGSQYILQSKYPIYTSSCPNPIFMWMCLDLRRASAYSYYYYLNSPVELGFDGYRLVGLPDTITSASDVCTETPDIAEFHMMIKNGHETDAVNAVQCVTPKLGYFSYTYTDSTGTYCENAHSSYINMCDNSNGTHVLVNNSDCSSINPFYSTSGQLGCIANVYDSSSDVFYISLYNLDSSPTTQFICTAVTRATDGTVYLSMKQTDCDSGQSPTTLPTGGATMILYCLPNTSKNRKWTWLFIFLPCLAVLVILIIVCIWLYFWLKKRETMRAKRKTALANADYPFGEVSMNLHAPASLGLQHGNIDRNSDLLQKTPQRRTFEEEDDPLRRAKRITALAKADRPLSGVSRKLDAPASLGLHHGYIDRKRDLPHTAAQRRTSLVEDKGYIFCEPSLDLNLKTKVWAQLESGKRPPVTDKTFSGAATTSSNGPIPDESVHISKASNSIIGMFKAKTKTFLTARMAANAFRGGIKTNHPKSYERSTRASSARGRSLKVKNEIHPEPVNKTKSVAGSRPGSVVEFRAVPRTGSWC